MHASPGRALSLVVTASLAAALGVPALAYAEDAVDASVRAADGQQAAAFAALPAAGDVAQVDGKGYASINEAISAAADGQTVKVLADSTMKTASLSQKSIVLDLNGCTVTADNRAFNVVSGATLTLDDSAGNGLLKINKAGSLTVGIVTGSGGSFIMKGGTLEVPEYAVYITNGCDGDRILMQGGVVRADYGLCAIGNGTAHSAVVEVSGGEVYGNIFGFGTNGSEGNGGVDFIMTGGTVSSTAADSPALYLPAFYSTATITGGTITGGTGIEIRAGELSISGDAKVFGTGPLVTNPNESGSTTSGAAIAVAQHTTKQPINVTVSGNAQLKGTYGLYEYNPQKNEPEAIANVKVAIEGGTVETNAPDSVKAVFSEDCTGFVTGGTFNTELPASAVADGYAALVDESGMAAVSDEASAEKAAGAFVEKDGKKVYYTSQKAAENANGSDAAIEVYCVAAGDAKYTSLAEAIAATQGEVKLTLLADTAESVVIPEGRTVVLDLAGFTLTGKTDGSGAMGDVITNKGALTIEDSSEALSGAVVGGTDGGKGTIGRRGIALVNEGDCTINGGTIKRGDDKTFGNYTVYNKSGRMVIAGGAVTNNSSTSSLIRNDGEMLVTGGEITQKAFNAVKNDCGTLTIEGGVITSDQQAVQNWCVATIKGGTLNGDVYTWAAAIDDESYKFLTTIEGGAINGNVVAVNYDGSDSVAHVVISGPVEVNGDVAAYDYANGAFNPAENGKGLLVEISKGTFTGKVDSDFVVPGSGMQTDKDGNLVVVEAKLVFSSDKVENGVLVYDVASGKELTEADLLALVGMNVDAEENEYVISVDSTELEALNKAIAAKSTSGEYTFEFSAVKNGDQADADAVAPLTLTVKLTDSSEDGSDDGSDTDDGSDQGGTAPSDPDGAGKDHLAATGDAASGAAAAAGIAAVAAAAVGGYALRRRDQE